MQLKLVCLFTALFLLTACSSEENSDIKTGVFKDSSAVAGLTYSTESQSGITNTKGQFKYKAGETIHFSLANLTLGESVTAQSTITTLDIVPNAMIYQNDADFVNYHFDSDNNEANISGFLNASNIMILLQTLDADQDPNNGLDISDSITTLINDTELDLTQTHNWFASKLSEISSEAVNQGLLTNSTVVKPQYALSNYYQANNIDYAFRQIDSIETNSSIRSLSYDEWGNVLAENTDTNKDGANNLTTLTTYNKAGDALTQTKYVNEEIISETTSMTYNDAGLIISKQTEYFDNGVIQAAENEEYTYDTNGNLISEDKDNNGDGQVDEIISYTYSADNILLSTAYDDNADGNIDITVYETTIISTFDEQGKLIQTTYQDENGENFQIDYFTYDENGFKQNINYDFGADGDIDAIHTFLYNDTGLSQGYIIDNDADGNADIIHTYEYEGDNFTKVLYDNDADGLTDFVESYQYNENNLLLSYSQDEYNDGIIDYIKSFSYDHSAWAQPGSYYLIH